MFKIQVLISGQGSTLDNLAEQCVENGNLYGLVKIVRVVANRVCPGEEVAKKWNLPFEIIRPQDYSDTAAWSEKLLDCDVDLHVMGGFLKKIVVPPRWENKVINIHPSIEAEFAGPGMYGMHVHQAVLAAKKKITGCTVHIVNNVYDDGPVLVQEQIAILAGDSAEDIRDNVQRREKMLYPRAILNYLKKLRDS